PALHTTHKRALTIFLSETTKQSYAACTASSSNGSPPLNAEAATALPTASFLAGLQREMSMLNRRTSVTDWALEQRLFLLLRLRRLWWLPLQQRVSWFY